ncbi:MAG: hypothetical protein JWQ89_830, partial [Devosia sp.]|nr:hypothetical protein [Devosia sp.]
MQRYLPALLGLALLASPALAT